MVMQTHYDWLLIYENEASQMEFRPKDVLAWQSLDINTSPDLIFTMFKRQPHPRQGWNVFLYIYSKLYDANVHRS